MKYFIDTEFHEGFHKPLFGKRRHFIDLISIGIEAEDGREYYAISNEFNPYDADEWVEKNVLKHIEYKLYQQLTPYEKTYGSTPSFKYLLKRFGKSNKQIAEEIKQFVYAKEDKLYNHSDCKPEQLGDIRSIIELYGYYSDYDWVVFCSLFGRMTDLPKGFPMYCIDLKQTFDEKAQHCLKYNYTNAWENDPIIKGEIRNMGIPAFKTMDQAINKIKANPKYPKQTNEHNALADAKWNLELYKFLNQYNHD